MIGLARERKFTLIELFQAVKNLLLKNGYEGFTFSILAEHLGVSRGTIYKYYANKDELITAFMIHELKAFLSELQYIDNYETFEDQFEFLMKQIFDRMNVHTFIEIGKQINGKSNQRVKKNQEELEKLHLEMYRLLQNFINLGKKEKVLKQDIPDSLILAYIFQSLTIPNHFHVPKEEWNRHLKELIKYGLMKRE